jgi:hypothetical protein
MTDLLYAAKAASATTSSLYTLNSGTAAPSSIGATGHALTALAFRPSDSVLFAASSPGSTSLPNHLFTIDPLTGTATNVGALGMVVSDIAFSSAGVLYGWAPSTEVAVTINTTTGAATSLGGSATTSTGGALSFHSDGTLYLLLNVGGGLNLYTVNTGSGLVSLVGAVSPFSGNIPAAATFDSSDLLWWTNGGAGGSGINLQTLNIGTIGRATIGAPGADFDALAWSIPVVVVSGGTGGVRIAVAFDDPTLEETPTWTYLTATDNLTAGYSIDRGRQYETDKTDTSTATVTVNDVDGILDPTNTAGPYYGKIEPLLQIQIELYDPVAATWHTRFRGFIEDFNYGIDPSQVVTRLQIECVDLFEILNAIEMQPGEFGDTPPAASDGQVFFDNATAKDRIIQALGNAGIPTGFYVVFDLNVSMQESVYSPGENILQVVQDAADAEFPTVSNVYCDRTGRLAVHGRLAKFDPTGTAAGAAPGAWNFTHWKAGDETAVLASITDTAQIRTLAFNRGLSKVFNSCLCTPNGIADADVAGQYTKDATSIGQYGYRSWSAENLFIDTADLTGNTRLVETHQYAIFIKQNYKTPRDRITEISFRSMAPSDPRAAANWALLTGCDISDLIDVTETSPGGGGFLGDTWFIEGVHEEVQPLNGTYADVTLSLDLSPGEIFIGKGSGTGYTLDS